MRSLRAAKMIHRHCRKMNFGSKLASFSRNCGIGTKIKTRGQRISRQFHASTSSIFESIRQQLVVDTFKEAFQKLKQESLESAVVADGVCLNADESLREEVEPSKRNVEQRDRSTGSLELCTPIQALQYDDLQLQAELTLEPSKRNIEQRDRNTGALELCTPIQALQSDDMQLQTELDTRTICVASGAAAAPWSDGGHFFASFEEEASAILADEIKTNPQAEGQIHAVIQFILSGVVERAELAQKYVMLVIFLNCIFSEVTRCRYIIERRKIGSGGSGTCHRGLCLRTGQFVCVKRLRRTTGILLLFCVYFSLFQPFIQESRRLKTN